MHSLLGESGMPPGASCIVLLTMVWNTGKGDCPAICRGSRAAVRRIASPPPAPERLGRARNWLGATSALVFRANRHAAATHGPKIRPSRARPSLKEDGGPSTRCAASPWVTVGRRFGVRRGILHCDGWESGETLHQSPFSIEGTAADRSGLGRHPRHSTAPFGGAPRARIVLPAASGVERLGIARRLGTPGQVASNGANAFLTSAHLQTVESQLIAVAAREPRA